MSLSYGIVGVEVIPARPRWEPILDIFSNRALLAMANSEWSCRIGNARRGHRRAVRGPRKGACPLAIGIFIDKGNPWDQPSGGDVATAMIGHRNSANAAQYSRVSEDANNFIEVWDGGTLGLEELREACLRVVDRRAVAA